MGRGLAAILSVAPKEEPEELRQIPTELITASPHQPRSTFDEAGLVGLADSIMVREDLNPIEEARACAALTEELGLSREEVGTRVGRSRVAVSNLIRLLELPDEVLSAIEHRDLSEGHGRALLLATDHGDRRRLARDAIDGGWSVRQLEERARRANSGAARSPRARPRRPVLHPDQEAAVQRIGDSFGAALGREG